MLSFTVMSDLWNLLHYIFWNLALQSSIPHCSEKPSQNTILFSITAPFAGSRFSMVFLAFVPQMLKQILNQSLRAHINFYFIMFKKTEPLSGLTWEEKRERLLSPSAFGKYGKLSVFWKAVEVADSIDLPVCGVLHLSVQLFWIDFPGTVPEQGFRKTWIKIREFESILYPFIFLFMKEKVVLIFFCV